MMIALLVAFALQDPDPKQVDELIRKLAKDDVAVREEAMKELLQYGERLLPLLDKYAKADDAELRARVLDLRKRLTPLKFSDFFGLADTVLKGEAKDWRPTLDKLLDRYVEILGDMAEPESIERTKETRTDTLVDKPKVVTENRDEFQEGYLFVRKAKGTELKKRVLLFCDSAEYEKIGETVIICRGDLKVMDRLERSIVFVQGKVEVGHRCRGNIIYAAGGLTADDELDHNTLLSLGNVQCKRKSKANVFVNTPERKMAESKDDRDANIPELPARKK